MLASSFGLSTSVLAALRAIDSMEKRPLDQGSTSRKRSTLTCLATEQTPRLATEQTPQIRTSARSTPTRPATEQTPEIPSDARSTPVLQRCDSAVEPDAAIEHIGMAWLSTIDDVTLISIFEHFANCYVAMPMVGTCKRIFITWTSKRRQFALEELTKLRCWFYKRELQRSSCAIREISVPMSILNRIETLIR